ATRRSEWVLTRVHPEDRDRVLELIERATAGTKDWELEHRLLMPDGTVKHLRVVSRAMRDEVSGTPEYVGAVMDVSAAAETRGALDEAHAEIQAALRARYQAALDERTRIAQELHDSLLQGFAGVMLHLKTAELAVWQEPSVAADTLARAQRLAEDALREARERVWD